MIFKFIPGALAIGLIATTSAQTPAAAPAKAEATTPAIEVAAKPKLDPAVVKGDSSYALGFRTGGGFAQQFGKFGVGADDLDSAAFLKGFMAAVKGANSRADTRQVLWGGRPGPPRVDPHTPLPASCRPCPPLEPAPGYAAAESFPEDK